MIKYNINTLLELMISEIPKITTKDLENENLISSPIIESDEITLTRVNPEFLQSFLSNLQEWRVQNLALIKK